MAAYTCLLGSPIPWMAAVGSFLAFAHSSGFGFLTVFLTTSALILCLVIASRSLSCHTKSVLKEESVSEEENPSQNQKGNVAQKDEEESKIEVRECVNEKEAQVSEKKEEKKGGDYLLSSSDALSDFSESLDHTSSSEDSENDWIFRENLNHNTPFSDGSISDEESLIEIELPESHYSVSKRQDQNWYGFQQKWPDCSMGSHFRQHNWMEMLNEMNEENLIEIDIFMGNIKSSRFEIEA